MHWYVVDQKPKFAAIVADRIINMTFQFFTVPLLHVLSVHVRVLVEWPVWRSWASLCGLPNDDAAPVPLHCIEHIPNLLSDPIALMLKFILLAPLHLDQGEFYKLFSFQQFFFVELMFLNFFNFFFCYLLSSVLYVYRQSNVQFTLLSSSRSNLLLID